MINVFRLRVSLFLVQQRAILVRWECAGTVHLGGGGQGRLASPASQICFGCLYDSSAGSRSSPGAVVRGCFCCPVG